MNTFKNKIFALAVFALMFGLVILPMPVKRVSGSDHIDSPIITQDRASDLGDHRSFPDPNDNSKVVMIMST